MSDGMLLVGKKDVSVGEYEARTGLTLITLQRGRLMFNMGPPSAKRAAAELAARAAKTSLASGETDALEPLAVSTAADESVPPRPQAARQSLRVLRSGVFTGRSLYAEEAVYLVQRGALVVHKLEELETIEELQVRGADTREALPLATLVAVMTRNGHLTTAFLDVYTFLRDSKLHPRRHVPSSDSDAGSARHARRLRCSGPALNVYKSITETVFVTEEIKALRTTEDAPATVEEAARELVEDAEAATPTTRIKKRKVKRLILVFRVLVRSFRDAMPSPRELRGLLDAVSRKALEEEEDDGVDDVCSGPGVPVKLAVASEDRSVVLFEVT